MKTQRNLLIGMSILALCVATACGGDDEEDNNTGTTPPAPMDMGTEPVEDQSTTPPEDQSTAPDEGGDEDMAVEEDIPTVGDLGSTDMPGDGCDEASTLITERSMQSTAAGNTLVNVTQDNGVWTAVVDATAGGGSAAALNNPFVYLDLDSGMQVAIPDTDAVRSDTTWELGFRRTVVLANSGAAGPGDVEIARLTGTTFEDVESSDIPADGEFLVDVSVNDACEVQYIQGGLGSVLGIFESLNADVMPELSWYDYSGGFTNIKPQAGQVYIIRKTNENKTYKFAFDDYDSSGPGVGQLGAVYTLKWAELQ